MMYAQFFGLKRQPFSIAPDPRYLFMSDRHREALAHLLYGLKGGGGFVLLTGEIGAGKTTVCRCFLEQIPKRCNVAYIFNPKLTVDELLKSVCDEFRIPYEHTGAGTASVKDYVDSLNAFLLRTHAVGQNNVLIIDEAQNLSADVLEQLRLLTNLETNERKLLQIILIGQPELRGMLARPELEQLAQRVTARFHLDALSEAETAQYIRHRLTVAGMTSAMPFDRRARLRIHQLSRGVPRRINLLCDRAMLGAYADGQARVDTDMVEKAASEVFDRVETTASIDAQRPRRLVWALGGVAVAVLVGAVGWAVEAGARKTALADSRNHAPVVGAVGSPASAVPAAAAASVRGITAVAPPASGAAVDAAVAPVAASTPATALPPAAAASSLVSAVVAQAATEGTSPFQALTRSEKEAWHELAPLWKLPLSEGDPCQAAARHRVHCFRASGGLTLLRQLGRPAILTLQDENDKPVYSLLTQLTEQSATLRMGTLSQNISLASLARMWRGDFATYWLSPPGYPQTVTDGSTGPVVDHLATQLAALQGQPRPAGRQTFDAAMKAKVHAFQLAQGLKPDGIPGPTTFMQLNRITGAAEPRLQMER